MKTRIFVSAVAAAVGLVLILAGKPAQANLSPVRAVEDVFTALNSGQVDTALASFSEDAVAENRVRGETYVGLSEIRQMLVEMTRNGRRLDIADVEMDGDRSILTVEVSDNGIIWGTETIVAELDGGKLQTFDVTAFRLELWRIH